MDPSSNRTANYTRRMSELHTTSNELNPKLQLVPYRWAKSGWRYMPNETAQDYLKHENKRNKFAR